MSYQLKIGIIFIFALVVGLFAGFAWGLASGIAWGIVAGIICFVLWALIVWGGDHIEQWVKAISGG